MTPLLIWLALSVVVAVCVCRVLALSGPGSPEKVIYTGYSEGFSQSWRSRADEPRLLVRPRQALQARRSPRLASAANPMNVLAYRAGGTQGRVKGNDEWRSPLDCTSE